ncbi:aromatic ring-hydroxylating oxygenase subunit alpha [Paraburkholderia caledonica]
MLNLHEAVKDREGYIDPSVFTDEDLYRLEMSKIFQKTWLYVGHESSIPKAGSYILNYMGENEVIVIRDPNSRLRVFLNRCPHRGNKLCLFDQGLQKGFTCSFHGWRFDTEGRLNGVADSNSYADTLKPERLGLKEVPRVSSYGGLIFASWDDEISSLDGYLGDIRWYLDRLLLKAFLGGIEVLPGRGKYLMPTNWKMMADNFMHDGTHVPITHTSFFQAVQKTQETKGIGWFGGNLFDSALNVLTISPTGVPHACGFFEFLGDTRADSSAQVQPILDRTMAERLGPEAVQWLDDRTKRLKEFVKEDKSMVLGSANWTIFPNLSFIMSPSALRANGIIQWHPRGAKMLEAWQWTAVEKDAPDVVKRFAASLLASDQAPAGMITIDDTENFDRMARNVGSSTIEERPFDYSMPGMDKQQFLEKFRQAGIDVGALPGSLEPLFTEEMARAYYGYYRELMAESR